MNKDNFDTAGEEKKLREELFLLVNRKRNTFFTNITRKPVMLSYGIVDWVFVHNLSRFYQFTMTTFVRNKNVKQGCEVLMREHQQGGLQPAYQCTFHVSA